ncbi:MAG: radical SAM protein [Planctomycetota bacterium]|nr:radical SAM protein [Planctomycetota bacterium]
MRQLHPSDRHQPAQPGPAGIHLFSDGTEGFLLDVESGNIHRLPDFQAHGLEEAIRLGDFARSELMAMVFGLRSAPLPPAVIPEKVRLKALSLAVAQKCNLGCTYCYAEQGSFGGNAASMPEEIAKASVDRLFKGIEPGDVFTLAFMGGEPLANRATLHAAARHAAREATVRRVKVGFTMTTNATLLRQEDIDLFQEYRFTITVSIDGLPASQDRLRPFVSGRGSYDRVRENVGRLLARPDRSFRVLARVTVTPDNLELPEIMAHLLEMGFDGVMFSPMLSAPSGKEEMQSADLDKLLDQLIQCGERFLQELREGRILPFSNVIETLQRIHRRTRDHYPCGAGGGYMAVSAEGNLYACHRFVNDERGRMGNLSQGVDSKKQAEWLEERHLQNQLPCSTCWARHLCSGSCHYEVINRGRPACDYIRGWLDYCLKLYAYLMSHHSEALKKIVGTVGPDARF